MNIVLIGMPGAGKSTLGVLLAKATGMEFIDTDILIQKAQGRLLQDIIDADGINAFLSIEEETLLDAKFQNAVIATGGSVVYSDKAMKRLKADGLVVYLHVPCEEISARLRNIKTRGIVMRKGCTLKEVYDERLPLYKMYADITVYCSGKEIEQTLDETMRSLKEARNGRHKACKA